MECPICLETVQDGYSSQCGHTMCKVCFDKWRNEQTAKCCPVTCPTCRFVIIKTPVVTVDLFAPPLGYTDADEAEDVVPFPSMALNSYLIMIQNEEYDDQEWVYEHEDGSESDCTEDWDGKDDWEYEDVDSYLVTQAYIEGN